MTQHSENQAILIVDDSPFSRALIVAAAEDCACSCEQAENGREALEKVKVRDFSLIFMDMLMPGIDGFETVRQMREMGVSAPIIALSALCMKQDKERALELGCNAFVPKPVDLAKLRAIITEHLSQQSGRVLSPHVAFPTIARPQFDFSRYRMLLVEEDSNSAEAHSRSLRHFGFNLRHVATCTEALDLLHADPAAADIIVSNLYTSGIDALGMLAIIRRRYPDVLVFIYTHTYNPDMYQLAMQQGADGIFPEAILEGSAIGMIESALYRRRQSTAVGPVLSGQLRQAQANLISFGCDPPCSSCELDFKSLLDAGGDIVRCRKFNRAGRCGFVLADIAGHDLASLYMGAVFVGILTSCWDTCQQPSDLLRVINAEFIKLGYSKSHVCVSAMLWDALRRTMHIATAGNPGALLYERAADGTFISRELAGGGMCLGLLKDIDLMSVKTFACPAESYLILFSDGIEKEAVQDVLAAEQALLHDGTAKGLCSRILKRAVSLQQDDMALLSYYIPPPHKPAVPCYSFHSTYEEVDRACSWAAEFLTPNTVPAGKDADILLLALREALLNAVEHGNRRNAKAFVDVMLYCAPQQLTIEVSDEGPGFDLSQIREEGPDCQLGKRGIPAMRAAADSLTVEGGTLIMVFSGR